MSGHINGIRIISDCRIEHIDSRLILTEEQAEWLLSGATHTCTDDKPCDARDL